MINDINHTQAARIGELIILAFQAGKDAGMKWAGAEPQEADWNTRGEKIVNDVYWRQEHEPKGKWRLDRLQELIDEEIMKAVAAEREECAKMIENHTQCYNVAEIIRRR